MLTTLKFTNYTGTVDVEFVTDLQPEITEGNFTVMQINGLSDAEKAHHAFFQLLNYDVVTFKTFAGDNDLLLQRIDSNGTVTLVDARSASDSGLI